VKARVLIRPKEGILDPHVRVGRLVELEAEDPSRLAELCEKLLANPLIEDFEIQTAQTSD
jgi:phosphoribosylformylglycinamidine synthase subunit PurS